MESILIVDDEKLNLKTLSALLKREYVAILAKNGEQGIAKAEKYQPELILLDIVMPGMDGFEVLKRLKANPATADIPVIILTGTTDSDKEELGLNLGACDYVHKPFNSAILKARIRTHISLQNQKRNLNNLTDQLKRANAAKSRFVANMSHEIRTPLTSVIGFAEALKHGDINQSEMHSVIGHIDRNGRHLLSLINDILDFSKIEADQLQLMPSRVLLFDLLEDIQTLVLGLPKSDAVEFELVTHFPLPKLIWVDLMRVRQVLVNLLSNAFKFTQKGQVTLDVSFDEQQQLLCFKVIDTGVGIEQVCKEKLFKPFSQADSNIQHQFGGTGLGLSISAYLAEKMAGTLSVESEPQQGSVFTFELNLTELEENELLLEKAQVPADSYSTDVEQNLTGNILVAEDDASIQKLIEVLLSRLGLTVTMVENGEQALEKIIESHFDMVFLDVQMPVMSGLETIKIVRQLGYEHLPIVALSAHVVRDEIDKYYQSGFDDFVAKPVERKHLLAVLIKFLATDHQHKAQQFDIRLPANAEKQLVDEFLRNLPCMSVELSQACDNKDLQTISKVTHRLKGSAFTFNYNEIGALASKIELSTIQGHNWQSIADDVGKLAELVSTVNKASGNRTKPHLND
ncbi:multi-sensor hybrid histidine kinase [Catenovulum agarivorans DS-2]|uniref:histidine kinase n=1 Tax=Catenovulum agarivorans DS-2 TaxID=1328313 RepID=W7QH26_9ALTE|nr:response regulator [Catenovulum agarivorans]EWH12244.1 multi-sensor hybrid histidine kinase [Catenovulum agarivorans DS-2]